MDTKNAALSRNKESGASQEAPAMDSLHREFLAAYLTAIRPSSLDIETPGVKLRIWYVASSFCHYHAEFSFIPDDIPDYDDSVIEEQSPVLSDLLANIQEISAASYAALDDRVNIEFQREACYHNFTSANQAQDSPT